MATMVMIFIGLFLIFMCLLLVNFYYKKTNYYKSTLAEVQKFIDGVPDQLDIVNTGSSHASYGFCYKNCSLKGFNLAIQPQTLEYDFKLLKYYSNNLNLGCIIFITLVCPFEFFCNRYADIANAKYYYFLPSNLINGYSKIKYFMRVRMPALSAGYNLRRLIKDIEPVPFHDNYLAQTQSEVLYEAQTRAQGWQQQFELESFSISAISDHNKANIVKNRERLNLMLSFCEQKQFRPVIVIPPVTKELSKLFSDDFNKAALYDYVNVCCMEKNIPILDYYLDGRLQDKKFYINSDFLNAKGRELFSSIVFNDLEKLGYIKDNK